MCTFSPGAQWHALRMFFKDRLEREADVLHGVICEIPSAVSAQAIAAAGADFLVIDREHGAIGRESMHAMIAATAGTACAALVRVPAIDEAEVKAALDAGAEGIVYPLIRSAEDARRCVELVTYPPGGSRGWGPFAAHSRFGTSLPEYSAAVGSHVTCCVLIETAEAVQDIDAIVQTPGIDFAAVAPFDLTSALGVEGRFDAPVYLDAVAAVEGAALGRVPLCGVAFTREQSVALAGKGYRVLLNGFDVLMLKQLTAGFKDWQ
jgi:4-hydroxy-2-oxoheptanedioate aldolase